MDNAGLFFSNLSLLGFFQTEQVRSADNILFEPEYVALVVVWRLLTLFLGCFGEEDPLRR